MVRHIVALIIGLVFGYFCFGPQAIHIAALPAACYVVIRTQSPKVVQRYAYKTKRWPMSLYDFHFSIPNYNSFVIFLTEVL